MRTHTIRQASILRIKNQLQQYNLYNVHGILRNALSIFEKQQKRRRWTGIELKPCGLTNVAGITRFTTAMVYTIGMLST
jgi:hypothetical protein